MGAVGRGGKKTFIPQYAYKLSKEDRHKALRILYFVKKNDVLSLR